MKKVTFNGKQILDYNMGMFDKSLDGMIVIGFISNDEGYEIIIKQEI